MKVAWSPMMDRYEERVQHYNDQQEELKGRYGKLQKDLQQNRDALGAKQSDIGKFEAEKDQHERNLQRREDLVKEKEIAGGRPVRIYNFFLFQENVVLTC